MEEDLMQINKSKTKTDNFLNPHREVQYNQKIMKHLKPHPLDLDEEISQPNFNRPTEISSKSDDRKLLVAQWRKEYEAGQQAKHESGKKSSENKIQNPKSDKISKIENDSDGPGRRTAETAPTNPVQQSSAILVADMNEKSSLIDRLESYPTDSSEEMKEEDPENEDLIYVTSVQIKKETQNISNKIRELQQETLQLLDVYNLCIDDKLK